MREEYDGPRDAAPPRTLMASRAPRRRLDELSELLERRADLRGAYAPADYMEEAVRWSA